MSIKDVLFRLDDEVEFKRQFVIQFLASYQASTYDANCSNRWTNHNRGGNVEDAKTLADDAWAKWTKEIGVIGIGG